MTHQSRTGRGGQSEPVEREALFGLAYRLLGSVADAEDAVQEAYVRWYRLDDRDHRQVASPRAWLLTTVGRIGLDMLRSARVRRERYVGEWLPEPVPMPGRWTSHAEGDPLDPADRMTMDESVSMALLIVLESMTPAERVAFVLHDVFRCTFPEVAAVVGRSPEACRQLAASARRRLRQTRARPVSRSEHTAAVRSFARAWRAGDLAGLVSALDPSATAVTDGGGIVSASVAPLRGAEEVAWFFLGVAGRQPDLTIVEDMVNGEAGLVATGVGRVLAVITFTVGDGRIQRVHAVRNPDKLTAWNEIVT